MNKEVACRPDDEQPTRSETREDTVHLVAIALISVLVGACTYWLYADIVTERVERKEHGALLRLVEELVSELNDDQRVPEFSTIGNGNPHPSDDIGYRGADSTSPPLTAVLRSAVEMHGPAAIERFIVEAVGEMTAIGHLIASFTDPGHPSERGQNLRVAGEMVFKKEDGDWRISGTVL